MLELFTESYGNYLLGIVCIIGILGTWQAAKQYKKLIRQTENMMSASHPFLLQIKNRFENTYRVNTGINNIGIFVKKNIQEYSYMGMNLRSLGSISAKTAIVCMILGSGFSVFNYWYAGESLKHSGIYLGVGVVFGLIDFWVFYRTNISFLEEKLTIYLQEYLENTMVNRMKNAKEDERYLSRMDSAKKENIEGYSKPDKDTYDDEASYIKESFERIASDREDETAQDITKYKMTQKEEKLINDILKDYFD